MKTFGNIIFASLLILTCCTSQNKNETTIKKIEFHFEPSFEYPSNFTIDFDNKTIRQYTFQTCFRLEDYIDSINPNIRHPNGVDTLIVHCDKTYQLNTLDLSLFLKKSRSNEINKNHVHRMRGLDGIFYKIELINTKNDTNIVGGHSPVRTEEYKIDYLLLDAFFNLAHKNINDSIGTEIIEEIQKYFAYRPVRITENSPLEIRIYGGIYQGCQISRKYLQQYIKRIPEEPIIFDCRNGAISHCLYWAFKEVAEKKQIYFYGNNETNSCWKESVTWLELMNENNENHEAADKFWEEYEARKNADFNDWKSNPNIKWFDSRNEVLKLLRTK